MSYALAFTRRCEESKLRVLRRIRKSSRIPASPSRIPVISIRVWFATGVFVLSAGKIFPGDMPCQSCSMVWTCHMRWRLSADAKKAIRTRSGTATNWRWVKMAENYTRKNEITLTSSIDFDTSYVEKGKWTFISGANGSIPLGIDISYALALPTDVKKAICTH